MSKRMIGGRMIEVADPNTAAVITTLRLVDDYRAHPVRACGCCGLPYQTADSSMCPTCRRISCAADGHDRHCAGTAATWLTGTAGYGSLRTATGEVTACCREAASRLTDDLVICRAGA